MLTISDCHHCRLKSRLVDSQIRCVDGKTIQEHVAKNACPLRPTDPAAVAEADAKEYRRRMIEAANRTPPYPGGEGCGIVMPGGGVYFDAAYVSIRVIRMLGCTLPIELWHLGPMEMLPWQRAAVEPLNVIVRDAFDIDGDKPAGGLPLSGLPLRGWPLSGWQLKPFAVCHSTFEKVLFLDADCYPVYDPTVWFTMGEPAQGAAAAATFWPDKLEFETPAVAFDTIGVARGNSRPVESGQFLVDRKACWRELSLTWWMNSNSDYYYPLLEGDKETWRVAWLHFATPMRMPPREYLKDSPAMIGFDFDDKPAFIHRCCGKLSLAPVNVFATNSSPSIRNDALPHEAAVWAFLEELRGIRGEQVTLQRRSCCG